MYISISKLATAPSDLDSDHLVHPYSNVIADSDTALFDYSLSPLLIFQRDITSKNVTVLGSLSHVRMSGSVIHHYTLNQSRIHSCLMLHLLQLDHVQIYRLSLLSDSQNGINDMLPK